MISASSDRNGGRCCVIGKTIVVEITTRMICAAVHDESSIESRERNIGSCGSKIGRSGNESAPCNTHNTSSDIRVT